MYLTVRLPVACFFILAYGLVLFARKDRLFTRTTQIFMWLGAVALFSLVATAVTEYTVNNRDIVPEVFNYVWHVLFLISLTWACGIISFYLLMCVEQGIERQLRVFTTLLAAVVAICVIAEIFLPITYVDTPEGSYSLGPKAYALYVAVMVTIVVMLIVLVRYRESIGRELSAVVAGSMIVFIAVAVVQIAFPYVLITDLAITMIALGMMIGGEDAHMYISLSTGLYNELGVKKILQELMVVDRQAHVGVYTFSGSNAQVKQGIDSVRELIGQTGAKVVFGSVSDNSLVVLPRCSIAKATHIPEPLPAPQSPDGSGANYAIEVVCCSSAQQASEVLRRIRAVCEKFEAESLQCDELTGLPRRASFIRQVELLLASGRDFAFIMVDFDNFKAINDTFGHTMGDKVLQRSAKVLVETIGEDALACRMGGDEIAIALLDITDKGAIERLMQKVNSLLDSAFSEKNLFVRLSCGVRICDQQNRPESFQEAYVAADAALYRSKSSGKARVLFEE